MIMIEMLRCYANVFFKGANCLSNGFSVVSDMRLTLFMTLTKETFSLWL